MGGMGGIVSLASYKFLFIRAQDNLVYDPSNNTSIFIWPYLSRAIELSFKVFQMMLLELIVTYITWENHNFQYGFETD